MGETRSTKSNSIHARHTHTGSDANGEEIQMTDLGTPQELSATSEASTKEPPKRSGWWAHVQLLTLCWTLFLAGWNDGTTGPLLPRIQSHYHIGYAILSLIFIFNCLGFVTAALANVYLTDKLGFGKVMVLGSVAQLIGYALEAPAPPFPVLVLGYAVNGFGLALQDAGANGFVASLDKDVETKIGILHAVYGVGALCAPLVSTQFSQMEDHWSFQYLTSLGIAVSNTILLIAVFRFKTQESCLAEIGQEPKDHSATAGFSASSNKYRQIFRLKEMHLLAFFIFIYIGVEVTLGGWTITYIIEQRGGGPNSGYISSGFFGGLTLGRVALLWVNKKVGERRVMFVYALLAISLELVVWLVPSLIGGGVAVSLVGVFLGPMFPIVINHCGRILPPWLLTGSIGWIAGFGQAGSAFIPFLTGALAASKGIWTLQPLLVAMMGCLIILWLLVPASSRRLA